MKDGDERHKYERLALDLRRLIEAGTYHPGDRLPSLRAMSQQERVSMSTVMQTYYMLEAQGWIETRPQSGFYVRDTLPRALPEPETSSPAPDPTKVSVWDLAMMTIMRDHLDPHLVHMGIAVPNPAMTAAPLLNRISASVGRRLEAESSRYEFTAGCDDLRTQIAQHMVRSGCHLSPADILITSGCQEAVSLSLRAVCRPGDIVAIESPCNFDILQCLEVLGLHVLEIPMHPRDGISLDALRTAIGQQPVRACVVISNFSNPVGSCMPDEHKQALVDLLAERDIPLIEIDIFGEIYFGEQRPLVAKAFDRKGLVLLCSSFSKTVWPGGAVGWVVPGQFKTQIERLKYTSTIATPPVPQHAIAEFMASGKYDHHLRHIRREYGRRMTSLTQAVGQYFPPGIRLTRPAGGFLLWIQLPAPADALSVYRQAHEAGIAIAPGPIFSVGGLYSDFIRLNAANWSPETEGAVRRLGEIIAGEVGG
jgi:DNA-binding transcriptional MocR family regulator